MIVVSKCLVSFFFFSVCVVFRCSDPRLFLYVCACVFLKLAGVGSKIGSVGDLLIGDLWLTG